MKKNLVALFLIVILSVTFVGGIAIAEKALQPGSTGYVTADVLNLRDSPQGTIVGGASYGTPLHILSGPDRNGYYHVAYNGNTYYAYGQYLTGTYIYVAPTKPREKITYEYFFVEDNCTYRLMFVTRAGMGPLALRSEPDKTSRVVEWLSEGQPVLVISDNVANGYGYFRIHTIDGYVGYAHSGSLSVWPSDLTRYHGTSAPEQDLSNVNYKVGIAPVFLSELTWEPKED